MVYLGMKFNNLVKTMFMNFDNSDAGKLVKLTTGLIGISFLWIFGIQDSKSILGLERIRELYCFLL